MPVLNDTCRPPLATGHILVESIRLILVDMFLCVVCMLPPWSEPFSLNCEITFYNIIISMKYVSQTKQRENNGIRVL